MEPIPESLEVLTRLSATAEVDLVAELKDAAARVVETVHDCVGLSIATLVGTPQSGMNLPGSVHVRSTPYKRP